jgi:hypothetical protein
MSLSCCRKTAARDTLTAASFGGAAQAQARMSVTTGSNSDFFILAETKPQGVLNIHKLQHTLKFGSHVGHLGGCHKPRKWGYFVFNLFTAVVVLFGN